MRSLPEIETEMRDRPNDIAREILEAIVDEDEDVPHSTSLERRRK